jgi:hypothetical protein
MGHFTDLYGCIIGIREHSEQNIMAISELPYDDQYPYLLRDMFALPRIEVGYQEQIFAFGLQYKSLESIWDQWLENFEALLRKMYWDAAHAHVITEMWGVYHFTWKPRNESYYANLPHQSWIFSGGPRTKLHLS